MTHAIALASALLLVACGGLSRASGDAARDAVDAAEAPPPTRVGAACASDGDCDGLRCATRFERMCAGPIRAHTWSIEFPGGQCNPALDVTDGGIPGGCPAGSSTITVLTACDGFRFRFCARRCASDVDCRVSEGYRCEPESLLCEPPALLSEAPDAGPTDG